MRKRVTAVVIGAVLGFGALAVAQAPPYTVQADRRYFNATWGRGQSPVVQQRTLVGNVVLQVNGVTVRADQAIIKDAEVTFEGNVRMTLPQPK